MVEELQMPQRGPRGVRDVPAEQFIRAYAEHLKANDKVGAAFRHGQQHQSPSQHVSTDTPGSSVAECGGVSLSFRTTSRLHALSSLQTQQYGHSSRHDIKK